MDLELVEPGRKQRSAVVSLGRPSRAVRLFRALVEPDPPYGRHFTVKPMPTGTQARALYWKFTEYEDSNWDGTVLGSSA